MLQREDEDEVHDESHEGCGQRHSGGVDQKVTRAEQVGERRDGGTAAEQKDPKLSGDGRLTGRDALFTVGAEVIQRDDGVIEERDLIARPAGP